MDHKYNFCKWKEPACMGDLKHLKPKRTNKTFSLFFDPCFTADQPNKSEYIRDTLKWLDKLLESSPKTENKIQSFAFHMDEFDPIISRLKEKFTSISEGIRFGLLLRKILESQQNR
jgi:hypothetical protein